VEQDEAHEEDEDQHEADALPEGVEG